MATKIKIPPKTGKTSQGNVHRPGGTGKKTGLKNDPLRFGTGMIGSGR